MTVDRNHSQSDPAQSSRAGDDWVMVGETVGVFGIRGEIKVRPTTDFPERFAEGSLVYLGDKRVPHHILTSRPHATLYVLSIEGVATVTDAERLRGQALYIPGSALAKLPEGQYYRHDILGLRVEHVNGAHLGVVTDVIESGPYDLYVVRDEATGREHLLPAVKAFIRQVDVSGGAITVEPIPGLFDEQAEEAR